MKTLSISRCISKSWNEFIISPMFVGCHQKQQLMENAPQLLLWKHSLIFHGQVGWNYNLFHLTWKEEMRSCTQSPTILIDKSIIAAGLYALVWYAFQQIVVFICAIPPSINYVNCRVVHLLQSISQKKGENQYLNICKMLLIHFRSSF